MLKKYLYLIVITALISGVSVPVGFAQEDDQENEQEEIIEGLDFTFGAIVRVSKDRVTISEYDFEREEEVEIVYEVNEATEFVNVEGLSALKIGDEIEIEFKEMDGKQIAVAIARDEGDTYEENLEVEQEPQDAENIEKSQAEGGARN